MKKLMIAGSAFMLFGALPALAASSNRVGGASGASTTNPMNPGAGIGSRGIGAGVNAPNTGPGAFQNNSRPRYTQTAPPVPGSAQDPYGNSSSGSSTGTGGAGTR
jgi:hypothetical protein